MKLTFSLIYQPTASRVFLSSHSFRTLYPPLNSFPFSLRSLRQEEVMRAWSEAGILSVRLNPYRSASARPPTSRGRRAEGGGGEDRSVSTFHHSVWKSGVPMAPDHRRSVSSFSSSPCGSIGTFSFPSGSLSRSSHPTLSPCRSHSL